jgi:hypothetical protein
MFLLHGYGRVSAFAVQARPCGRRDGASFVILREAKRSRRMTAIKQMAASKRTDFEISIAKAYQKIRGCVLRSPWFISKQTIVIFFVPECNRPSL